MKKFVSLFIALALCGSCLCFAAYRLPDFSVTMANGEIFTLSDALDSHDAVIIYMYTDSCLSELKHLERAYGRYADRLALVCPSRDTDEEITAFMQEKGISDALISSDLPVLAVVDRFGNLAYTECGSDRGESRFVRIFDYFLSDTYTGTEPGFILPDDGNAGYYVTITDENGAPISGVIINICTDSVCNLNTTDENGAVYFEGPRFPYSVHVIKVPMGYRLDASKEYVLEDTFLSITVPPTVKP